MVKRIAAHTDFVGKLKIASIKIVVLNFDSFDDSTYG